MKISLCIFCMFLALGLMGCSESGKREAESRDQVAAVPLSAQLRWLRPVTRANGDYLHPDQLGGYELRYRHHSEQEYHHLTLDDPWLEEYELTGLGDFGSLQGYEFLVAAFDNNGLYSNFVTLRPYDN